MSSDQQYRRRPFHGYLHRLFGLFDDEPEALFAHIDIFIADLCHTAAENEHSDDLAFESLDVFDFRRTTSASTGTARSKPRL
jgi:hypothetical protein